MTEFIGIGAFISRAREWGISMIRTVVVPPIVGYMLLCLVQAGITLDEGLVTNVVYGVCVAAWYGIMRGVELAATHPTFRKIAGLLLGYAAAPVARVDPALTEARPVNPRGVGAP
jgi:hypothetical protein